MRIKGWKDVVISVETKENGWIVERQKAYYPEFHSDWLVNLVSDVRKACKTSGYVMITVSGQNLERRFANTQDTYTRYMHDTGGTFDVITWADGAQRGDRAEYEKRMDAMKHLESLLLMLPSLID
jgi:hypothetical protein